MIKRTFVIFFTILLVLVGSRGLASDVSIDKATVYQRAILLKNHGDYQKAADEFSRIPGYADSKKWNYYCLGKIDIENATEYENAGYISDAENMIINAARYFELLAKVGFEDSGAIKKYCSARRYELKCMDQPALDAFAELLGVLDSDDRYWRIINGPPLPTQAPINTLPAMLALIPAQVSRKAPTYYGPGDRFLEQTGISVNAGIPVSICGREGSYYLIEMTTDAGKLRTWVPTIRIKRDDKQTEAQIGKNQKNAKIPKTSEALLGPGRDYISSGITLNEGISVTALEAEGLYTMIEYKDGLSGKSLRMWFPTSQLYIQD